MPRSSQVLSFGELLIDLIATGDASSLLDVDTLAVRPGGAPANVAVSLVRQDIPAALCAVVGQDPFGERLLGVLDRNRVDRSRVRQDSHADTTLAFAWKDQRGDGHFRLLRQADVLLDVDDVTGAAIEQFGAIAIGSVSLSKQPSRSAIEHAVELANAAGVPVCFDVNMRPSIWPDRKQAQAVCDTIIKGTTLLKLSLGDARFLLDFDDSAEASGVIAAFSDYACQYIVVTDGARGAWFSNRSGDSYSAPVHVPAFEIDAVEPTGAGDAFTAALIVRLSETGWTDLSFEDVTYASAAGALTTTRPGAIDSLPARAEIEAFLHAKLG